MRILEFFFGIAAWGTLSWALCERGTVSGSLPVSNVFEIFQCLGWFAVFFVLFLRCVWGLRVPLFFGSGAAMLLCALGFANVGHWDVPAVHSGAFSGTPWIAVHVIFAMLGYAFFSAAAMAWLGYLLQNSALRKHRTHPFFEKLPDLTSLDRIAGRLCSAGVLMLGAGAMLGGIILLAGNPFGTTFALYKFLLFVLVFLSFSGLILLRRNGNISALKFARGGLAIFVAALILLGGSACIKASSDSGTALQEDVAR